MGDQENKSDYRWGLERWLQILAVALPILVTLIVAWYVPNRTNKQILELQAHFDNEVKSLELIYSDKEMAQKYAALYAHLRSTFVQVAVRVLDIENIHDRQFPSVEYKYRLLPLEEMARFLQETRKSLDTHGQTLLRDDILDPEFCFAMAKFLQYSIIDSTVSSGNVPGGEIRSQVSLWLDRHREAVTIAKKPDWLANNLFFQGFVKRYETLDLMSSALQGQDTARFFTLVHQADTLFKEASDLATKYGDSLLVSSCALNRQALAASKYCVRPNDTLLGDFARVGNGMAGVEELRPITDQIPEKQVRLRIRNATIALNKLETLLALDSLKAAEELLRPLKAWWEDNKGALKSYKPGSHPRNVYAIIPAYEWCRVLTRAVNDIRSGQPDFGSDSISALLDKFKRDSVLLEFNSVEPIRDIVTVMKLRLQFAHKRAVGAEEEANKIYAELSELFQQKRRQWYYDLRSNVPQVLLRRLEIEIMSN